ncbi:MAG: hypothetical protein IPK26_16285 [Planctomycetes bacterium]|nr:hypothetical protein [Planctomycetota bacterium]
MKSGAARWAWLLLVGACQSVAPDPLARAERALAAGDLLAALTDLDSVPVAHARYPQARTIAAQIERRLRRSHEQLLSGLLLRSEWRDAEALAAFESARQTWPALPAIDGLIVATRQRQRLFPEPAVAGAVRPAVPPSSIAETQPVEEDDAGASGEPASGAAEVAVPSAAAVAAPAAETAIAAGVIPPAPPDTVPTVDEVVATRLAAIEEALSAGRMDSAVGDLMALFRNCPDDLRVRRRLARVLLQRGLVRYGRGDQQPAVEDWRRASAMDPTSAAAALLAALGN